MKKMVKPEIEFIRFNAEDVITTSGGDPSEYLFTSPVPIQNNELLDDTNGKSTSKDWTGLGWNIQQ